MVRGNPWLGLIMHSLIITPYPLAFHVQMYFFICVLVVVISLLLMLVISMVYEKLGYGSHHDLINILNLNEYMT